MTKIMLPWDKDSFTIKDQTMLLSLAPHIDGVKIGLQAMTTPLAGGGYVADALCIFIKNNLGDLLILWDAKLHDIGNTMLAAAKNIVDDLVHMMTFHLSASDQAIRNVVTTCGQDGTLALGVTVLTDLSPEECLVRYGATPDVVVPRLVKNAKQFGLRGLVCSPQELKTLQKAGLLADMTTVIPGIRPLWAQKNDQVRTMTPVEAARAGANWIVVGRPILDYPADKGGPIAAARLIREELDAA